MVNVNNISLTFGEQVIFDKIKLQINPKEKIGLVGINGSGKSTLLNIIAGVVESDSGEVEFPKNYTFGYVRQHLEFTEYTVLDEACLALKEHEQDEVWKVEKILLGLGFTKDNIYDPPDMFSGGYQVRLNLAKVLISDPNLLILDEPTNYLDIVSIRWLTQFLKNWKNELIMVTHDKNFMDNLVTHTVSIHRKAIRKITGNSQKLYDQIAMDEEVYEKTRLNAEKKRKKEEEYIAKNKARAAVANLVQSRVKKLEREGELDKLEKIKTLDFKFNCDPFNTKKLIDIENISFDYNKDTEKKLINDFSLEVNKNDRICIIGKNGKGKSTLLKMIAKELKPDLGKISYHANVKDGYFGQTNIDRLNPDCTIEQELLNSSLDGSIGHVRSVAGVMMFPKDNVLKKVTVLSGGEKSRVMLGKILLKPTNLLLLDEPTNHLDMDSCDALMEAIDDFDGAVIIVTHSEMFLNDFAKRLVVFDNEEVSMFEGNYQEFLETKGWSQEGSKKKKKKKK